MQQTLGNHLKTKCCTTSAMAEKGDIDYP